MCIKYGIIIDADERLDGWMDNTLLLYSLYSKGAFYLSRF